jgi:glutaconate CoA-transferase subunit A
MAEILSLREAVARFVRDGDHIACEGFTHLIPFAAGHEIVRQNRQGLHVYRMTPDLIYDQMIGMGLVRAMTFGWGGNPGVGSLHRFREAVERGWPQPLELDERSHADMANSYVAGASGLPCAIFRGYAGSHMPRINPRIRSVTCPFTGEVLAAVPSIRLDVAVIHAQQADRQGNVLLWGVLGVQKEAVMAAKRAIVTVEEIVDELNPPPNACVLPHWVVSAVCHEPGGAFPSYAQGYYDRDNRFYLGWDPVSRDRERFLRWMRLHVLDTGSFAEFRRSYDASLEEAA